MLEKAKIKTAFALVDFVNSSALLYTFGTLISLSLISGQYISAAVQTAMVTYGCTKIVGFCTLRLSTRYNEQSRELELNPNPWEKIDSIEIIDEKGLENILETTAADLKDEWITFSHTSLNNKTQFIKDILPPKKAKEYTISEKESAAEGDLYKVKNRGWQAHSHFHTAEASLVWILNYVVTKHDRMSRLSAAAHLLSFNTPKGPEIIGYNHKDTFIPKDCKNKRLLVKASRDEIIDYLLKNYF